VTDDTDDRIARALDLAGMAGDSSADDLRRARVQRLADELAAAAADGRPLDLAALAEAERALAEVVRDDDGDRNDATHRLRERLRTAGDWLEQQPDRMRCILRQRGATIRDHGVPVMPRGIAGILAASGGTGKTMAALELAILIAAGGTEAHGLYWLGCFHVAAGRVLYVNGEDSPGSMHRRIYNAAERLWPRGEARTDDAHRYLDAAARNLHVAPLAGTMGMALVEHDDTGAPRPSAMAHALSERLDLDPDGEGWALVVLDPLARFAGGDAETDNAAATVVVQAAELLTEAPGNPAVLLTHHTRKGGSGEADAIRGASALHDGVRWAMTLHRQDRVEGCPIELVTLRHVKSNETPTAPPHTLTRQEGGGLRLATDDETDSYSAAQAAAERERIAERTANQTAGRKAGKARAERDLPPRPDLD